MAEETPENAGQEGFIRIGDKLVDPMAFEPGIAGETYRRALETPEKASSRSVLGEDYEERAKKAAQGEARTPSGLDPGTSLLPPTIANDLRENDLEDLIPTLRQQIHEASSGQPGEWSEENKLRVLINQAYEQPKFKKRLEEGLAAGNLGEGADEKVRAVLEIVNSAKQAGTFEQLPSGALGRAVQARRIESHRLGPKGQARVYLTADPDSGATAIDTHKTHSALKQRYYTEWFNENVTGKATSDQVKAANKYAAERAARDLSQTAARFTQVPFLEARNPEMVKKIAQKGSAIPLGVRAHLKGRTTTNLFAPTLEELQKEGGIWGFFRKVSPFEYAAPQMKLAREHLEKEHPRLAPWLLFGPAGGWNVITAGIVLGSPLGLGERALERAGYTREEIVQEYLDGRHWWDESSENLALLTKESFLLQGHSEEEAELERQRAKKSFSNKAAAFFTYFGDPDGITVGLMATGRAAKLGVSHYYRRELERGLVTAKRAAAEAETPAEAIKLIDDINPSLAHILNVHISAGTAEDVARLGDTSTKLGEAEARLQQVQQRLAAAGEDVSEDLSAFIREFVYSGQSVDPSPEMLRLINDMRANPKGAGYRGVLDELGRSYDESLEVAALNLQRGEEAAKEHIRITKELKELRAAVLARDTLAKQLEETIGPEVFHGLAWGRGSEAATSATKEFWYAERRTRQLQILLDRLDQIEDMTSIPAELKERIFIEGQRVSAKGRFVAGSPTLDDLSTDQLKTLAGRMRIPNRNKLIKTADGREELKQMLREGRIFQPHDWAKIQRELQDRLNTLLGHRKTQIKDLKRLLGAKEYDKLIARRESFLDLQKKFLAARRAAPEGSERSLIVYRNMLEELQGAATTTATRADSAIQQAVRSYSLRRVMDPKSRLKLPTGPRGRKIREAAVVSKVFRLGQDSPDLFRLSRDEAAVIDRKLRGVAKEQKAFAKAEKGLEKAQRQERWRTVMSDVVDRMTAAKAKLSEQKIWETVTNRVRNPVDTTAVRKVLNKFATGVMPGGIYPKGGAAIGYQRGGKSIVQAFEEIGIAPKTLHEALDQAGEAGLHLQRVIEGGRAAPLIPMTPALWDDIREVLPKILQTHRVIQDKAEIQALIAIRSQANLPKNQQSFTRRLISMAISPFAATIKFMGTPGEQALVRKVGTTTEETGQLIRASDQLMNQTVYELERLTRLNKVGNSPDKFLEVLGTYFNGGNPIPLSRRGVPEFTVANVGEPLFKRAKRRVISWHAKLSDAELAKAAKEASLYTARVVDETATYDPVVLAFSRAWLGKDVPAVGSSQAANLYQRAVTVLSDPNINTFEEAVEAMKKQTLSVLGPEARLDYDRLGRVYGFAANAIALGAVQDQLIPLARATTAGLITPNQMLDVNRVLGGSGIGLKKVKNADEVFDTLWRIGNPLLEDRVAQTFNLAETADRSKKLVKLATDPQGEDIFVVGALRTELMSSLNGKIKELHSYSNQQPGFVQKTLQVLSRDILPWWKQSATMGWLIPNAGYITYVRFGDMSQLFMTSGVRFTARSQLQNVWSDIPLFGRALQNHLSSQVAKTKSPQLRGLLETTFSPHFSDFFSGKQGFWRLKNGDLVSWEGLRKRAVLEGITDVFPAAELEEGLRQAGLSTIAAQGMGPFFRKLLNNDWSDGIKAFSTQTQIRQRVGTWLLHISDGKTIDEASKLVRESLYDWSHGVSRLEQQTVAQVFPFWRYWRLAMAQTYEGIIRPFMNPTKDGFAKAMYGNTRMARLRELIRLQMDTDRVLSDPRSIDEIAQEDGYSAAFGQVMTPDWLPRQLQLYNRRNSMARQDLLAELQAPGRQMLNTAGVGAPTHGIDQLEGLFLPFLGMLSIGLKAAGEDAAAEHFSELVMTGFMDKLSPYARDVLEKGYSEPGTTLKAVRPVEAWILENMTLARVEYDPETGQHFASRGMAGLVRISPVMGSEIPRFLDAVHFKNPNNEKLSRESVKRFFLEYTRIIREYSYDPYLQFDLRMRSALARLKEDENRAGYLIEKPK